MSNFFFRSRTTLTPFDFQVETAENFLHINSAETSQIFVISILETLEGSNSKKLMKKPKPLQIKQSFIRACPFAYALMLPMIRTLMLLQTEDTHPGRKEELVEIAREKAVGLAEDMVHYLKLNGRQ